MGNLLSGLKGYLKRIDLPLLLTGLAAALYGLFIIYSAGSSLPSASPLKLIVVQGAALAIGLLGFIVITLVDIDRLQRLWLIVAVINILFQLSLFFIGVEGDTGNRSWIRFGPIGIQPGELGKILFIFSFGCHLSALKDQINRPLSVLQILIHGGATILAMYIPSRDLGVAITYLLIMLTMMLCSPLSPLWTAGFLVGSAALAPVLWNKFLSEGQKLRILVVFNPEVSPRYAYQGQQSLKALHNGGLLGMGYRKGALTQSIYLPARHTDFIFASCGEELGYIGCTLIILLLAVIIARIFMRAAKMTDMTGYLVAVGVGAMFLFQSVINIGMCLGVMPVIGLTLPFFSYGGSSIMTCIISLGLVSAFYYTAKNVRNRSLADNGGLS